MKIIIDIDKKTIEVPENLKKAYEEQLNVDKMLGNKSKSILEQLNTSEYKIISKHKNSKADKTSLKDIEEYMNSIKSTNKEKYEEYTALLNKGGELKKDGKPKKTNFLIIKKWFYTNFPEKNPFKD